MTKPGITEHTIIAGRVSTWEQAERTMGRLVERGFDRDDVESFFTGPSGRHGTFPLGGDVDIDAGAKDAGSGAARGAALGGAAGLAVGAAAAAVAPVTIPVLVAATGVGAYGGALVGGVSATHDGSAEPADPEHPVDVPGGVVVAVRTDPGRDPEAIDVLRDCGAVGIERSRGQWRDGGWVDFDPVGPREFIDPAPGRPQA